MDIETKELIVAVAKTLVAQTGVNMSLAKIMADKRLVDENTITDLHKRMTHTQDNVERLIDILEKTHG